MSNDLLEDEGEGGRLEKTGESTDELCLELSKPEAIEGEVPSMASECECLSLYQAILSLNQTYCEAIPIEFRYALYSSNVSAKITSTPVFRRILPSSPSSSR